jgi:hypothetical protein
VVKSTLDAPVLVEGNRYGFLDCTTKSTQMTQYLTIDFMIDFYNHHKSKRHRRRSYKIVADKPVADEPKSRKFKSLGGASTINATNANTGGAAKESHAFQVLS